MTKGELLEFTKKSSVEVLSKFLHGLDLISSGGELNDFTDDEKALLVTLRDEEQWFRELAGIRINKRKLDVEKQDASRRKFFPARWGK